MAVEKPGCSRCHFISLSKKLYSLTVETAVEVPCFVARACSCIRQYIETEGIFRKAGSTSRQRELRAYLDGGKKFEPEHHVIDVANILKMFFRELPEPLLPHAYHEVLLRCLLLHNKKIDGILLTCLLLPSVHVNTLAFMMQFLQEVASHSDVNKMDIKNLAIIVTPSVMPVEDKIVVYGTSRLTHHVQVVELLISNADKIGSVPENVSEKLTAYSSVPSMSNDEQDSDLSRQSKKKKKRRSGSLTRMLNGLKKMVGKGTPEVDESHLITSTPDFSTPCVKSSKKRKAAEVANAFSSKKKKDVLQILPQSVTLANIPYTPSRSMAHDLYVSSPVCAHPNPSRKLKSPQSVKSRHRRFFTPKLHSESVTNKSTGKDRHDNCKKNRLSVGSWSGKKQKPEELAVVCNPFGSDISYQSECASRSPREGIWSAGPWGRKKHLNLSDVPVFSPSIGAGVDITSDGELVQVENQCNARAHINLSDSAIREPESACSEMEFVRIPKSEYEAIKSRVSAIENRISQEFGNMVTTDENDTSTLSSYNLPCNIKTSNNNTELVQSAYERTLEKSEKLGDASADQLARRLSRELRIRRSLETKVIRSPSARKIGTIRRRSKENTKPVLRKSPERNELTRNMSWHLAMKPNLAQISQLCPQSNLKRGRPNTVLTGLPQPSPRNIINVEDTRLTLQYHHKHPSDDSNGGMMSMTDLLQYTDICRESDGPITRSKARRASSFHGTEWIFRNQNFKNISLRDVKKSSSHGDIAHTKAHNNMNMEESKTVYKKNEQQENEWQTAGSFFSNSQDKKEEAPVTRRVSIAKLRSQNAGMVLERMKLFDAKSNCNDKEKCLIDAKSKKHVQVPNAFVCHVETGQSLRVQYSRNGSVKTHCQSVQRTQSPVIARSCIGDMRETFKDSPKKIGTPRKKQSIKSPHGSQQKQKFKILRSPSKVDPNSTASPASIIRRKHNSLKLARDSVCTNVKANLTVPVNWLSTEKENVLSPTDNTYMQGTSRPQCSKDLRDEFHSQCSTQSALPDTFKDICSPALCKMSVSPLKDCNRIEVNSHIPPSANKDVFMMTSSEYRTPRETPYIKKALLTKSPSNFNRTPQSNLRSTDRSGRRHHTPMKALVGYTSVGTPVGSPRRQSPRLLLLKSRNIS